MSIPPAGRHRHDRDRHLVPTASSSSSSSSLCPEENANSCSNKIENVENDNISLQRIGIGSIITPEESGTTTTPPLNLVQLNFLNNNVQPPPPPTTQNEGPLRKPPPNGQTSQEKGAKSAEKSGKRAGSASSAILEAKRKAQAELFAQKRVTRNSAGREAAPEVEIVVMKDHLQPARDMKPIVRKGTGVVYDAKMLDHACPWDPNYPEKPERLSAVVDRCERLGLLSRCVTIPSRSATEEEIIATGLHTKAHLESLKDICAPGEYSDEKAEVFSSQYDAIYVNPTTYQNSLLSAGSCLNLVSSILEGRVGNGMALVRPPGHHAMESEYCGYCFLNNVALCAKSALQSGRAKKVLIVDFDVHHGQATQRMFYDDPRVLYFSTHRYEHGAFWPNLPESDFNWIGGQRQGKGFNVNVPLNQKGLGNGDFLAIWHQLLVPLAYEFSPDLVIVSAGYDCLYGCFEFNPDLVLVSAGFDSLQGDEKGEMELTPQAIPQLLHPLLGLAGGKVAVILEGGYCIKSLAEGAALSLRALLGDPCPLIPRTLGLAPTVAETILNSLTMLRPHWGLLKKQAEAPLTTDPLALETLKALEAEGRIHKPSVHFEGPPPTERPAAYATRDCYPLQSEALKREIEERLDALSLSTSLARASNKVGLLYDDLMLKHRNLQEPGHPETPERISNIFACHVDYGLLERCHRIAAREATEEELALVHDLEHIALMKRTAGAKKGELEKLQGAWNSIFLNNASYQSALLAAGSLLQVVDAVVGGEVQAGVAIVRPPGHHAEESFPCGFCLFNNVAVAAKHALENHGLERVLIVDWDVHHGNGIQHMFESDPRVLYMSLHRYDHATFFPSSPDANYSAVGSGRGLGYNVNIPWNAGRMGDTEYLAAFTQVVLPIAYAYGPQLVIVSAGFDAARGDPLGGCSVSPEGYAHMTHLLMGLANGRVILALEGGYNLTAIAYSMVMCTKALLGDPLPPLTLNKKISSSALQTFESVLETHAQYWDILKPFRKLLVNSKENPVPLGDYDVSASEEVQVLRKMEGLEINSDANDNSGVSQFEQAKGQQGLEVPPIARSGSSSGNNSSFEMDASSPVKSVDAKETVTMTLVLDGEYSGAVGGGEYSGAVGGACGREFEEQVVLVSNFDESAPAAVYPKSCCPHLDQVRKVLNDGVINTSEECLGCGHIGDNWVCLTCYKVFCGRFVNAHMVSHSTAEGHQLALSFADLSIWCYGCDSYVRHEKLFEAFSAAHLDKFNEAPPPRTFSL